MTDPVVQMLIQGNSDLEWYNRNLQQLEEQYENSFIAFHNDSVIEADENLDRLIERLRKRGLDTSQVMVRFVSKVRSIL
jgi:uncharacterized protein YecE (DUF72 family)